MALVKCADCGTEISERAPSCIKCGAPVTKPAPEGLPVWVWVLSVPVSLLLAAIVFGVAAGTDPEVQARQADREVIDACRAQIADPLLSPATREAARFMCNGLRNDYVKKHGREP